jgi:quercetin dioxygenase-like cupin family protein
MRALQRPARLLRAPALGAALVAASLAGCGDAEEGGTMRDALGGSAGTQTLARERLESLPPGPLAWVAHEVVLDSGEPLDEGVAPGFVYVRRGMLGELGAGEAVAGRDSRTLVAGPEGAAVWEIRLAAPGSGPEGGRPVFESEPLEGIPKRPLATMIEVSVPPRGGRTTVHTHPGPEFIYMTAGEIDYQNALVGTKRLGPGGAEAIPPDTPVQKRNPYPNEAVFLSWFLVDPDQPFAPPAEFER